SLGRISKPQSAFTAGERVAITLRQSHVAPTQRELALRQRLTSSHLEQLGDRLEPSLSSDPSVQAARRMSAPRTSAPRSAIDGSEEGRSRWTRVAGSQNQSCSAGRAEGVRPRHEEKRKESKRRMEGRCTANWSVEAFIRQSPTEVVEKALSEMRRIIRAVVPQA